MSLHLYENLTGQQIRYLLLNARRLVRKTRGPVWALAHDMFAVGSNSAHELCRRAGFDPETAVRDLS